MICDPSVQEIFSNSSIEVRETTDRGYGVFAKTSMSAGTLLIRERAAGYSKVVGDSQDAQASLVQLLQERIDACPRAAKGILSLYSRPESARHAKSIASTTSRLNNIVRYNSFGSTINNQSTAALWFVTSRMNHACISNCFRRFDEDVITVVAKRDIAVDEELQISYVLASESFESRQHYTSTLGFQCECALCRLERTDCTNERQIRQKILVAYLEEVAPQIDRRGELDLEEVRQLISITSRVFQYIVDSYIRSGQTCYWYDLSKPGPALAVLQLECGLLDDAIVTLGLLVDKCNDGELGAFQLHTMSAAVRFRGGAMTDALDSIALSAQAWLVCNPLGDLREYWREIRSYLATYASLAPTEVAGLEDTIGHVFKSVGKDDLHPSA